MEKKFLKIYQEVREDTNLNWNDKALLSALISFYEYKGKTGFSNSYMTKILGMTIDELRYSKDKMRKLGYIDYKSQRGRTAITEYTLIRTSKEVYLNKCGNITEFNNKCGNSTEFNGDKCGNSTEFNGDKCGNSTEFNGDKCGNSTNNIDIYNIDNLNIHTVNNSTVTGNTENENLDMDSPLNDAIQENENNTIQIEDRKDVGENEEKTGQSNVRPEKIKRASVVPVGGCAAPAPAPQNPVAEILHNAGYSDEQFMNMKWLDFKQWMAHSPVYHPIIKIKGDEDDYIREYLATIRA